MKTLKTTTGTMGTTATHTFGTAFAYWLNSDIVLNLGFTESLQRGIIALFVPWPFLLLDNDMLVFAAPIMFYLFITALVHFCFIRYAWQHWFYHLPEQPVCDFATNLDIPVKTI